MNCPNCFKELEPNQKFCPYCGTKISEPEYAPAIEPEYDEVKTLAADFDELPELEPAQPEEQSAWQPSAQPAEQPVQQYQPAEQPVQQYQPTEQPVQQHQPTEQPVQQYQPTEQPVQQYQPDPISPKKDFSQQYQQYQQGSGMAGTRQGDGSLPPDKNKTPLIIAIVIAAVVLIGAGVFAAIWIFGGCDKKGDDSSSSSSSSQSTEADSSKTDGDSSTAGGDSSDFFGSDTQSSQSSAWSFDSSDTDYSSAVVPQPGNSNTVVNKAGLELAEDSAIDTSDSLAETKIDTALKTSNMNDKIELGMMTIYIYAQGNALVYEYVYTSPISSADRAEVVSNVDSLPSKSTQTLTTLRTQTGVSDMVMVYAYVDSDGSLITSAVCK